MINKKLELLILSCIVVLFATAICNFGQEKSSELKDKRITLKYNRDSLGNIFRSLIVDYNVPIGFEESVLDRNHNEFNFETNLPYGQESQWKSSDGEIEISVTARQVFEAKNRLLTINVENAKLENVLNIIIEQMPNYKWEINNDVVNIFPANGRNEKCEKLLGLKIENFSLEEKTFQGKKTRPILLIKNQLTKLPEVISFMDENRIYIKRETKNFEYAFRDISVEMNFSNLTFRELLNKITKIKGGGWILRHKFGGESKEKEYIEIDI